MTTFQIIVGIALIVMLVLYFILFVVLGNVALDIENMKKQTDIMRTEINELQERSTKHEYRIDMLSKEVHRLLAQNTPANTPANTPDEPANENNSNDNGNE